MVIFVVVGKTVIGAELVEDGLEAKKIRVKSLEFGSTLSVVVAATSRSGLMCQSAYTQNRMSQAV